MSHSPTPKPGKGGSTPKKMKRTAQNLASPRNTHASAATAVAMVAEPPFSFYIDETRPTFAEGWASVVKLLQGRKNIAVLTGAGISVSCGIPDFRSKESGLYSTLDTAVRLKRSCHV
jgi:Sir2 family